MILTTLSDSPTPHRMASRLHLRLASRLRTWLEWAEERRQMKMMLDFDDRILDDIGLSRSDVLERLNRRP